MSHVLFRTYRYQGTRLPHVLVRKYQGTRLPHVLVRTYRYQGTRLPHVLVITYQGTRLPDVLVRLEHTKVRNYLMFCGPSTMVLVKGMNGFMGSRYSRYRQYFRFSDSTYSCTVDDNIEYRLCCLIKI